MVTVALSEPFAAPRAELAQAKDADVKVEPLPDPPAVDQQLRKSDIIVRAVLLHNRSYKVGRKTNHQARFRIVGLHRTSLYYRLAVGDEFSVLYTIKSDVFGPHFMEPPETGEYLVLLELKNVTLGERVVGQDIRFVYPNPFALYEPSPEVLKAIGELK